MLFLFVIFLFPFCFTGAVAGVPVVQPAASTVSLRLQQTKALFFWTKKKLNLA